MPSQDCCRTAQHAMQQKETLKREVYVVSSLDGSANKSMMQSLYEEIGHLNTHEVTDPDTNAADCTVTQGKSKFRSALS
eukprot:4552390-Amphidinium_carterae.1